MKTRESFKERLIDSILELLVGAMFFLIGGAIVLIFGGDAFSFDFETLALIGIGAAALIGLICFLIFKIIKRARRSASENDNS